MKKASVALIILGMILTVNTNLVLGIIITDVDNDGVITSLDCNDNNPLVWHNIPVYLDNDLDGVGSGELIELCIGESIPPEYVSSTSPHNDCNDSNADAWQYVNGYKDLDEDSFGDNNQTQFCIGQKPPAPYILNNGDCNDSDSEINPNATDITNDGIDQNCDGFDNIDYDNDGYFRYNLNLSLKDCNDINHEVHPGAIEICNGIDDNCDGGIDEGFNIGEVCFVGVGECKNEGLMICSNNGLTTRCRAVAKEPSAEICDGKDNDCDNETDEGGICDSATGILNINFPDKIIYNSNNILINLSINLGAGRKADKITYVDYSRKKPKEIILCKKCNEYGKLIKKIIKFKDGLHNITFNALYNGTIYNNLSLILVDTEKPKISSSKIRTKGFTNGTFFISYEEDNLKEIILFYDDKNITSENCSSGKNQNCSFFVNLSEYEGKDIRYSFKIFDNSGNFEKSKNAIVNVDITPPLINEISYPTIGNYVFFKLNITEPNFQDISYYDNSDDNPKWKILCSILKKGICEKVQRFKSGEHSLTMRILDKAGNSLFGEI